MGCDSVGTPKLLGVLGVFGFPSLVSVPLRRWDQLFQLTGHNLHPTYLRVTSNITEKYEKYLWYWYPMTQLSSQSCLQHQESIPQHLFLTGVLWALKFELLWSNFKKGVTTMLWKFFLSISGSSGQFLKFSSLYPQTAHSSCIYPSSISLFFKTL